MELDPSIVLLLILAALVAGMIDSIAGGGGLITVPALLATGMPPTMALATNKLQSSFGSGTASFYFWRKGYIEFNKMRLPILCTFVGSAVGTVLVQRLDSTVLSRLLPFLLIGFALYFLFSPRIRNEDSKNRLSPMLFAILVATSIGFYDGFFGPGTGSFFAFAFVVLAGYGITKATAHTKLLNFTSNIASLIVFAHGGQVLWIIGLIMATGQFIGSRIGSQMVISHGTRLVKPLLVIVSLLISIKLIWDHYF